MNNLYYENKIKQLKKEWGEDVMKEYGFTENQAREYINSLSGICIPCLKRLTNNKGEKS